MTIFDDDNDWGIDNFAASLFAGEVIAEFDRNKKVPEDPEPLIPDDNKEQWEKE